MWEDAQASIQVHPRHFFRTGRAHVLGDWSQPSSALRPLLVCFLSYHEGSTITVPSMQSSAIFQSSQVLADPRDRIDQPSSTSKMSPANHKQVAWENSLKAPSKATKSCRHNSFILQRIERAGGVRQHASRLQQSNCFEQDTDLWGDSISTQEC